MPTDHNPVSTDATCEIGESLLLELDGTLCCVAQLLNGWHADGTAWSEWDESVRKDVSRVQRKVYDLHQSMMLRRADHPSIEEPCKCELAGDEGHWVGCPKASTEEPVKPMSEDFAPSYVCTKCLWVGVDAARHPNCQYELIDVNRKAREAIAALRSRLPEGMQNCTIRFRECAKGHGWLTADNWVQHDCPTCERDALRSQVSQLERERDAARTALADAANEIACSGPVAHRIRVLRKEHGERLSAAEQTIREQAERIAELEKDFAEHSLCGFTKQSLEGRVESLTRQLSERDAEIARLEDEWPRFHDGERVSQLTFDATDNQRIKAENAEDELGAELSRLRSDEFIDGLAERATRKARGYFGHPPYSPLIDGTSDPLQRDLRAIIRDEIGGK